MSSEESSPAPDRPPDSPIVQGKRAPGRNALPSRPVSEMVMLPRPQWAFWFRVAGFAAAILMLVGFLGWSAYSAWRETEHLRDRLKPGQIERYSVAAQLQNYLLQADKRLVRYEETGDFREWRAFATKCQELYRWLQIQYREAKTPHEEELLGTINASFGSYVTNAVAFHQMRALGFDLEADGYFRSTETIASYILDQGDRLSEAHRQELHNYIADTVNSISTLQSVGLFAVVLIGVLGAYLAVMIYRDQVAPLRARLLETRRIIEQQEKLASLGILAAGIAHEIRNPLTSIRARLFTQKKGLERDSRPFRDAEFIGQEIDRLERVLNDFLSFARPQEPRLDAIPAARPMEEVCALLQPQLEQKSIELAVELMADAHVMIDLDQIKQVLINLIKNAAEAIGSDGRIVLRVRTERSALGSRRQPAVVLEVEDNGPGIAPEICSRLFDPFFTTKAAGTGLGLSICARIVERHGGQLRFQTQVGSGTTFSVLLPPTAPPMVSREEANSFPMRRAA